MLEEISKLHDGRLDVLVPNAGMTGHEGKQLTITEEKYDKLFDLNLKSTFFLISECYPMLLKSKEQIHLLTPRALGRAGREQADGMTWAASAEKMTAIYRDLLEVA